MRRYDKMTKEEIMEFTLVERCSCCELYESHCKQHLGASLTINCNNTKRSYLNEELDLVPRVALINTREELLEALRECRDLCDIKKKNCDECYGTTNCFVSYLAEDVEKGNN